MEYHRGFVGCLFLWFITASVSADPSVCYYCTTDADGTACNDARNTSAIRVQYCGNLTVTENFQGSNEIADGSRATNGTYVCTKITYTSSIKTFVTIRECQSRQVEGVNICNYLSNSSVTSLYSRDFSCQTCSSDLCNSANIHFSSFAFIAIIIVKLIV